MTTDRDPPAATDPPPFSAPNAAGGRRKPPTIDLTALRLLAVATRHAWLHGHHLTIRNPGPAVRRMVHLSRLAHAIEVERAAATA